MKKKFTKTASFSFSFIEELEIHNIFNVGPSISDISYEDFENKIIKSLAYSLSIEVQFLLREVLKFKFDKSKNEFEKLLKSLEVADDAEYTIDKNGYKKWTVTRYSSLFDQSILFDIISQTENTNQREFFNRSTKQIMTILEELKKDPKRSELRKKMKTNLFKIFSIVNIYFNEKFHIKASEQMLNFYQNLIDENLHFFNYIFELHSLKISEDELSSKNFNILEFVKTIP